MAGNWKMFKTAEETRRFFDAFMPLVANATHCEIIIAPPFPCIAAAVESAQGTPIGIAGQNCFWEPEGAYTGEVSVKMLKAAGCRAVIVGHSERRQYFGETDESVNRKVKAALDGGLTPILCVGETLAEREAGLTNAILERQLDNGVASLTPAEFSRILIAYEPVWAIGTGRTATPEIAADAHRHLRGMVAARCTPEAASALRILYGGSVKPDNIRGLMAQTEIDGGLVGGASLDPQSFASIVNF